MKGSLRKTTGATCHAKCQVRIQRMEVGVVIFWSCLRGCEVLVGKRSNSGTFVCLEIRYFTGCETCVGSYGTLEVSSSGIPEWLGTIVSRKFIHLSQIIERPLTYSKPTFPGLCVLRAARCVLRAACCLLVYFTDLYIGTSSAAVDDVM